VRCRGARKAGRRLGLEVKKEEKRRNEEMQGRINEKTKI
jgi:hypothetical protein